MGLGKKIIDFIAPPIKQKVPKQEIITGTEQETQKKKQTIGVQNIEEIEYEILESNINASEETTTEIPELEVEEYTTQKQTYSQTANNADITVENVEQEFEMMPSNTSESLSYQEYEQMTKDIEHTTQETKNDLDMAVENITSHYKIAEIPLNEEENQMSDITADLYTVQLFDNSPVYAENQSVVPELFENTLFENAALTYFESTPLTENLNQNKFAFSPLEELSENKKATTQQIDIEDFTHQKNPPTEKFIFSDNKKSITLPIHTSMQTELSNPIDYQPTDIQKITESISLEAPAMNALLKNAVRTIMQRKGIQEITPETLPLIKDDLSLVLEASGSNLSTMVGDVLQIKKIVNDKVNERRDKINEYKNELTQKISQLLTQVRHLESEVGKLDNIIYTDIEELTKINKTLDTYQMLLASISEQKFNFE